MTALAPSAPASGLDRNAALAKKAAAPHTALIIPPQAIPAPAGPVNAFRSPTGTARDAAGRAAGGASGDAAHVGVLGGVIGGVGGSAPAPQQSSQVATIAAAKAIQPQWSLSEDGIPQRSDDSGHTWQNVAVDASVQFRALYADQQEVWVGGPAGVLYHSSDLGAHWNRVRPTDGAATLSGDIARIQFKDPLHGDVTTTKGAVWTTADGGVGWFQH
jgi:photosynthesis system II assembly factor YCF48-like protein